MCVDKQAKFKAKVPQSHSPTVAQWAALTDGTQFCTAEGTQKKHTHYGYGADFNLTLNITERTNKWWWCWCGWNKRIQALGYLDMNVFVWSRLTFQLALSADTLATDIINIRPQRGNIKRSQIRSNGSGFAATASAAKQMTNERFFHV